MYQVKQNLFWVAQLRDDLLTFTIDVYHNATKHEQPSPRYIILVSLFI